MSEILYFTLGYAACFINMKWILPWLEDKSMELILKGMEEDDD